MEEKEKLLIVIQHWIEHNRSHMTEYQKWVEKARDLGLDRIRREIEEAVKKLSQVNQHLEKAMGSLRAS